MPQFDNINPALKIIAAALVLLLLGGCGTSGAIDASTPGFFNHYVIYPFSYLILQLAVLCGGSYGLALIVLTVAVKLLLLPFMLRQYKGQQEMKRKQALMQPELDQLKLKYKPDKAEDRLKLQEETLKLHKKHGYDPLAVGCLPMLLQLPILSGLYYAIRLTPELSSHSFLWFQLGHTDIIMPFIAAAVYFVQVKVSQSGTSTEMEGMQRQLARLSYLSPVMMAVFSFTAPAALPLYWAVGGIFVILQTLLAQRLYPALAAEAAAQKAG
ncbi:hypothetical protein VN24_04650 [Paenibacillus beijingensis]|uniref:Membrane protein insertase YidC n=1 Tax=Paenibacillus beijingensis TaxID=1126833 RepID=A0A0D5NQN9_9BACL|nr:hypothetical protein VN24_04650 [Paenibacillus beijingensis]